MNILYSRNPWFQGFWDFNPERESLTLFFSVVKFPFISAGPELHPGIISTWQNNFTIPINFPGYKRCNVPVFISFTKTFYYPKHQMQTNQSNYFVTIPCGGSEKKRGAANPCSARPSCPVSEALAELPRWLLSRLSVRRSSHPFLCWQKCIRSSVVPILLINKIHLSMSRHNVRHTCKLYGVLVTRVMKLDRTARQIALYRQNRFIHYTALHEKAIASCRMAFRSTGKKKCLIFCMS